MNKMIVRIKEKIASKDRILNGSLIKQYKQCGKINCRCHANVAYWHGPYFIWTRKENGKTITKTLTKNQATAVKKAIKDMKELKKIIEKWRELSLKEIENL